jgi:hypothetical protein
MLNGSKKSIFKKWWLQVALMIFDFLRYLAEDERDGASYNIQYLTTDMSRYFDYINIHAPLMRTKGKEKFGEKFHAFRTVLKQL